MNFGHRAGQQTRLQAVTVGAATAVWSCEQVDHRYRFRASLAAAVMPAVHALHCSFHLVENDPGCSPLPRELVLLDIGIGCSPSPGPIVDDGENLHLLPPQIL